MDKCRNCAQPLTPNTRFCPNCGTPVLAGATPPGVARSAAQPDTGPLSSSADRTLRRFVPPALSEKILAARDTIEGSRRNVTVMFADISGFTALARSLDPEAVAEILEACLGDLSAPIYLYEGMIDKYMGDAIMALFGAPIAHEDDPERALRAALTMKTALADFNARWATRLPRPLDIHIGINTGLVIARSIGTDLYMSYTVIGDTVNLASRLADQAEPGEVLVSQATRQQTARLFDFTAAEPLQLKGLEEPVSTYKLLSEKAGPKKKRGIEGMQSPLVGRQSELGTLQQSVGAAANGRGGVLWVVGEAGAGKSRLVTEARTDAAPSGRAVRWLVGRSVAYEQTVTYGVFRQIIRHWLGVSERAGEAVIVARLHEELRRLIPDLGKRARVAVALNQMLAINDRESAGAGRLDLFTLQRQTYMGAAALFEALAQDRPLAVVLDDLHWADPQSLALLNYLQPLTVRLPLLLVCISRPDFAASQATRGPARLGGVERAPGRLALTPLSITQIEAMIDNLLEQTAPMPQLVQFIADRSEGNPFYVEELIGALIDHGVLARSPEGWRMQGELNSVAIPNSLHALIAARLDLLSPNDREVLEFASLLGRNFTLNTISAVMDNRADLPDRLDRLVDHGLLDPADPRIHVDSDYTFRHVLVHDLTYGQMLNATRARRHCVVGEALEKMYGIDIDSHLALLANHFQRSDDAGKGIEYSYRAAEHARTAYAYLEAARLYQWALDVWPPQERVVSDLERVMVIERLADSKRSAGDLASARALWLECLPARENEGETRAASRLLRKIGAVSYALGDNAGAMDYLLRGLRRASGLFHDERARLANELALVAFRQGDYKGVARWAASALSLGELHGLRDVSSEATNTIGISRARSGDIEGGIEYVKQSLEIALAADLPRAACRAYANLGMLYGAIDHDRALDYCQRGLELARKIGDLTIESWLRSSMASTYCTLAVDWEQGVLAAEAAIELDKQLGYKSHQPVPLILIAQIYQCHGAMDAAEQYYREALQVAQELNEPQFLFPIFDGLAAARLMAGDEAGAIEMQDRAQAVLDGSESSGEAMLALPFLT